MVRVLLRASADLAATGTQVYRIDKVSVKQTRSRTTRTYCGDGASALHAADCYYLLCFIAVCFLLVPVAAADGDGASALHAAAAGGHIGVVELLIGECRADLGARNLVLGAFAPLYFIF